MITAKNLNFLKNFLTCTNKCQHQNVKPYSTYISPNYKGKNPLFNFKFKRPTPPRKKIRKLNKFFFKNLKIKVYFQNPLFLFFLKNSNKKSYHIYIKLCSNNVFYLLKSMASKKTLLCLSAGKCKQNISKKTLKVKYSILLKKFLTWVKKFLKKKDLLFVHISSPLRLRKKIIRTVYFKFKKKHTLLLNILEKKPFNGCQPKKRKRKKQKGLKVFK